MIWEHPVHKAGNGGSSVMIVTTGIFLIGRHPAAELGMVIFACA